jgi:hypothetical protein
MTCRTDSHGSLGIMLGMIPPWRVVMHLDSRLFMAYLTGCIPGEPLHSQAPLTVAAPFLTTPYVTIPPPFLCRPWPRERIIASRPQVDRRWVAQGKAFSGDTAQARQSYHLLPDQQSQWEGADLTRRSRQRVLLVRPLCSAPALYKAVGPHLPGDEGIEAVHEATLGRIGISTRPKVFRSIYTYCISRRHFFGGKQLRVL